MGPGSDLGDNGPAGPCTALSSTGAQCQSERHGERTPHRALFAGCELVWWDDWQLDPSGGEGGLPASSTPPSPDGSLLSAASAAGIRSTPGASSGWREAVEALTARVVTLEVAGVAGRIDGIESRLDALTQSIRATGARVSAAQDDAEVIALRERVLIVAYIASLEVDEFAIAPVAQAIARGEHLKGGE